MKLLLGNGADVKARDKGIPSLEPGGYTALLKAVRGGHVKVAETLLKAGAKVNERGPGFFPISAAAARGSLELIMLLLSYGADPNLIAKDKRTALIEAADGKHIKAVKFLLSHGANPNARDEIGKTALIHAASDGDVDISRALLRANADVNLCDIDGTSALMWAAIGGHSQLVRLLLAHGARVNAVDRDGMSALDYACRAKVSRAHELVRQAGGGHGSALRKSKAGMGAAGSRSPQARRR